MDTRMDGAKFISARRSQFPGIQLENSGHLLIASFAQAVFLSLWHDVHGFGIAYLSVISGEMKRNVCA